LDGLMNLFLPQAVRASVASVKSSKPMVASHLETVSWEPGRHPAAPVPG
jgi:hypothetical protein